MNENPQSIIAWEDRFTWFKSSPEYRALDRIDGEPMEFEWNIFPRFNTLQLSQEVQELLLRLNETPENFTRGSKDNKIDCESNAQLVSVCARRFGLGQWSFLGPVSQKNGILSVKTVHKVNGTKWQKWWWHSQKADTQSFEPTSPLSRGQLKSKSVGKLSIHYCADQETITTVFAQLLL